MKGEKNNQADDYDSPWKQALEVYLQPILEFCFPRVARAIDWMSGQEFLDKELQSVVRESTVGSQRVDKLIKVRLKDGTEEWILVHVEVQSQHDRSLPKRVYQYHYRIRERFGRPLVSLVILADDRPNWRPCHYEEELLGCRIRFDFPVCKLLDVVVAAKRAVLAQTASALGPAAVIILANWLAQKTRQDMPERGRRKWELTRRLYEAGFERKDIIALYGLIDWLLHLPDPLEREYRQQLSTYEDEKHMPHVTSIERMAREEAQLELVLKQLRRRVGPFPDGLDQRLRELTPAQIEALAEALLDFTALADLETWLQSASR